MSHTNDPKFRLLLALAGANDRNLIVCPVCEAPGERALKFFPRVFRFRDVESVRRYRRSGCCQDCQLPLCIEYDGDK